MATNSEERIRLLDQATKLLEQLQPDQARRVVERSLDFMAGATVAAMKEEKAKGA